MQHVMPSHHGFIQVLGPDAQKFLQGQATSDVLALKPHQPQYSALCNAKGRVLASFYIIMQSSELFLLELPKTMLHTTVETLKKYAMFSKVELQIIDEHRDAKIDINEYLFSQIRAGIIFIEPATMGEFTPHDLAMPQLNAVSFNKGCYTGQEIIARMHYLGKLKQHLCHIRFASNHEYNIGDKLLLTQNIDVTILSVAKNTDKHYEALVVAPDVVFQGEVLMDVELVRQYK